MKLLQCGSTWFGSWQGSVFNGHGHEFRLWVLRTSTACLPRPLRQILTAALVFAVPLVCISARGDLTRLLGMRMVAFLGLMSEINSDVALSRKAKVVGGICFSKAMFWDSKYHVRRLPRRISLDVLLKFCCCCVR